jgi:hypothetical protein
LFLLLVIVVRVHLFYFFSLPKFGKERSICFSPAVYFITPWKKMPRQLCSTGTITGLMIAGAGIAAIVVYIVLAVQQHNDLALLTRVATARHEKQLFEIEAKENVHGHKVGKSGPVRHLGASPTVAGNVKKRTAPTPQVRKPMEHTAQCNGPHAPNCTRWDIWSKCFIPLVDKHPKDGFITTSEIVIFMDNHLRFYERWAAPAPEKITHDCDKKRGGNGRVNWAIFKDSQEPGCLGSVRDICMTKGACERELEKLGLPPVTIVPHPGTAKATTAAASKLHARK